MTILSTRLSDELSVRGLSIPAAAELSDVDYQTLFHVINSDRSPRLNTLVKLVRTFDLYDLFFEDAEGYGELDRLLQGYGLSTLDRTLVIRYVTEASRGK